MFVLRWGKYPKASKSNSQRFRCSFPRGAGAGIYTRRVCLKMGRQREGSLRARLCGHSLGPYHLEALCRRRPACNYRERFNSDLPRLCSLGATPSVTLGPWDEVTASSTGCWLVWKALQTISKGNNLCFSKGNILG